MRTLFLSLLVLFSGSLSYAQLVSSFGIKAGATTSNQKWLYKSTDLFIHTDYLTATYAGVTAGFLEGKKFSLMTDLAYSVKGGTNQYTLVGINGADLGTLKEYSRFHFISFSPMVKMNFKPSKFTPYLFAGPRIDAYMGYSIWIKRDGKTTKSESSGPGEPEGMNTVVFGVNGGGGLEWRRKQLGLTGEIQVHYDITDLMDTDPTPRNTGLNIHTFAFVSTLGIKYYFSKEENSSKTQ